MCIVALTGGIGLVVAPTVVIVLIIVVVIIARNENAFTESITDIGKALLVVLGVLVLCLLALLCCILKACARCLCGSKDQK